MLPFRLFYSSSSSIAFAADSSSPTSSLAFFKTFDLAASISSAQGLDPEAIAPAAAKDRESAMENLAGTVNPAEATLLTAPVLFLEVKTGLPSLILIVVAATVLATLVAVLAEVAEVGRLVLERVAAV